jgi:hypothetical protein
VRVITNELPLSLTKKRWEGVGDVAQVRRPASKVSKLFPSRERKVSKAQYEFFKPLHSKRFFVLKISG